MGYLKKYGDRRTALLWILIFIAPALSASKVAACEKTLPILAFPGAEGGGKFTTGGRGGMVLKVTNLNDSGPGSLRQAVNTNNPRTVIFEISGNIELKSPLVIKYGDLTIAGQTAPGDGICIKGHETRINAGNIIIRFIRFRPGDISGNEYDALTGMKNSNIIIDHCSMSWSTDETVSFYDNENFTLQWCIISESLNNSVHRKGPHGYGGIWGGRNATFTNNLFAHHSSRNPRLQGTRYVQIEGYETVELINNIIYNWCDKAIYGGENGLYNIIGNIFIPGPATEKPARSEILEPYEPFGKYYLESNVFLSENDRAVEAGWDNVFLSEIEKQTINVEQPFKIIQGATVENTKICYQWITEYAGASLNRDIVDLRIINEVRTRSFNHGDKGIINSQEEVGGWPVLKSTAPLPDVDGDGIPDEWEIKNGLNPNNSADSNAFTLHPHFTNLEIYLNGLVKNTFPSTRI